MHAQLADGGLYKECGKTYIFLSLLRVSDSNNVHIVPFLLNKLKQTFLDTDQLHEACWLASVEEYLEIKTVPNSLKVMELPRIIKLVYRVYQKKRSPSFVSNYF